MILLLTSSALVACQSIQRPDAMVWGVNAQSKTLRGYNLRTDFDNEGNRLPEAKPKIVNLNGLQDLNAFIAFDPKSVEELKRYIGELRLWAKDNCK